MDINKIRRDFPFFSSELNKNIIYLDSSATTQKPQVVIDAISDYYTHHNANINRGSYQISVRSTDLFENTRRKIAEFINAPNSDNIVFTKGTTESLNLVAYGYGLKNLKKGDEILISVAEHHANLVNWQFVCEQTGANLVYFYLDEHLNFDLNDFESKLNKNTKIVSFTAQSNVLSFDVPISRMISKAKSIGAITILDAAQYVAHKEIDVQKFDCDFLAFSGHKIYSEQGVGVLYGKKELLDYINPLIYGGDMIEYVHEKKSTFAPTPNKFEGGSQNISAVYSLSVAIDYINSLGLKNIRDREKDLIQYVLKEMQELDFIKIYAPTKNFSGVNIIFTVNGVHPHDVSQVFDFDNIAIRAGHHCTQVLHRNLGINSSCRISVAFYNTFEELDKFIETLKKVRKVFYGN